MLEICPTRQPWPLDEVRTMYGMKKLMAVLVAFLALVAFTGCEPASTVTATVGPRNCLNQDMSVSGRVTPADATTKVVLQRTVGGKWVDFEWYATSGDSGEVKAPVTSTVNSAGGYNLFVPRTYFPTWTQLNGTIHFRVRTQGNGGISPSWYTTFQTC